MVTEIESYMQLIFFDIKHWKIYYLSTTHFHSQLFQKTCFLTMHISLLKRGKRSPLIRWKTRKLIMTLKQNWLKQAKLMKTGLLALNNEKKRKSRIWISNKFTLKNVFGYQRYLLFLMFADWPRKKGWHGNFGGHRGILQGWRMFSSFYKAIEWDEPEKRMILFWL